MNFRDECRALCSSAAIAAAISMAGCAAAKKPSAAEDTGYAGWYTQRDGQGSFQPCGRAQALLVRESAELRAGAKKFGLEDDTPVYVRLSGVVSADGNGISVKKVDQFGSPSPVRDCSMTGLQIQSAAPSGKR